MEHVPYLYKDIKGWGVDADPDNEPTYPIKHYTGADHMRLSYQRPRLQVVDMEILRSTERPNVSAVYGTSVPPSGLSGTIRRMAYRYSENRLRRWLPLVIADRVNVIEGIIDDLRHGHIPNIFAEKGWKADWKYDKKTLARNLVVGAAVATLLGVLIYRGIGSSGRGNEED